MSRNDIVKKFGKRLFLICPTDHMEMIILENFKGEAFFYTALGVYFEYDFETQSKLCDLILENEIDQIAFVSTIDNAICTPDVEKKLKCKFPVKMFFDANKTSITNHLAQPTALIANLHLQISKHLSNQKKRLLSTDCLGRQIKQNRVLVNTYVYDKDENTFYGSRETEQRIELLNRISCN